MSWQTSLMCIVVELAGGVSVAVAVGVALAVAVAVAVGFIGFGATVRTHP